jgi:hypothetical protein
LQANLDGGRLEGELADISSPTSDELISIEDALTLDPFGMRWLRVMHNQDSSHPLARRLTTNRIRPPPAASAQ